MARERPVFSPQFKLRVVRVTRWRRIRESSLAGRTSEMPTERPKA